MSVPVSQRRRPTLAEIKSCCTGGVGGLCYTLNIFTFSLLTALGYDCALCHATCTSTVKKEDNHIFVVVRNLDRDGDSYLVETGLGFPTFRAVSLDFEFESPVFVDSFLEYKYIKHGGLLLRMHSKGDTAPRPDPPRPDVDFYMGEWRWFYYSDLKCYRSVDEFDACFDAVYTDPTATNFHTSPRALCFPHQGTCLISLSRYVNSKDGCDVRVEVSDEVNMDEVVSRYKRHFPQIGEDMVRQAYAEWKRVSSNDK